MATIASAPSATDWTAADLVEHFGPIALRRIRHDPTPGRATEKDVIRIHRREKRLYELVDGVLVEKTVGVQESYLAVFIASVLSAFVRDKGLGIVLGDDGMAKLGPGLIRIPDVSFIAWDHYPGRRVPATRTFRSVPTLPWRCSARATRRKR